MSLFARFEKGKEAEFREAFVKPLLNRLGFYGVAEQHGSSEFGKDFVFSELHRLGGMRHYAAVVKHAQKINQGLAVDEVLTQVKQCFAVPFTRPDSPRPCHVSSVYVFNSGAITDNARQQIAGELVRERYGDNVHVLDGERLQSLNEHATFSADNEVRTRLLALRTQMNLNVEVLNRLIMWELVEGVGLTPDARGFIWAGLESYLSGPVDTETVDLDLLYNIWQRLRAVDQARVRLTTAALLSPEVRKNDAAFMKRYASDALQDILTSSSQVERLMSKFVPLL
jgi:hypothetical protein